MSDDHASTHARLERELADARDRVAELERQAQAMEERLAARVRDLEHLTQRFVRLDAELDERPRVGMGPHRVYNLEEKVEGLRRTCLGVRQQEVDRMLSDWRQKDR